MPRKPGTHCSLTWEQRVGSTLEGNLPQYKVGSNPCNVVIANITYPGVVVSDFRAYHKKCPYSSQSTVHKVRDEDPASPTYWTMVDLVGGEVTAHDDTKGVMIRRNKGFLCVDDNCYYYTANSKRFFYR